MDDEDPISLSRFLRERTVALCTGTIADSADHTCLFCTTFVQEVSNLCLSHKCPAEVTPYAAE